MLIVKNRSTVFSSLEDQTGYCESDLVSVKIEMLLL